MTLFSLFALYRMTQRATPAMSDTTQAVALNALTPVSLMQSYDKHDPVADNTAS